MLESFKDDDNKNKNNKNNKNLIKNQMEKYLEKLPPNFSCGTNTSNLYPKSIQDYILKIMIYIDTHVF